MERQDQFESALKNLREKVVDRGVFGAEEAVELIDLMLTASTGSSGEPEKIIPPPPDSNAPPSGSVGGTIVG